jgi:hypothetical protein
MSLPSPAVLLAWFLLAILPNPVFGGLIFDPSNGATALLDQAQFDAYGGLIDDQLFTSSFSSLPAGFKYFGAPIGQLSISANGSLTDLSGTDNFFTTSFAQGHTVLRIAPLWDDYLFLDPTLAPGQPANQIFEQVTSNYYSVTWQNVRLHLETSPPSVFPFSLMSTQVAMFAADTMVRGFQFRANDIVFGFTSQTGSTGQFSSMLVAETGLNQSSGVYSRLPGLASGDLLTSSIAASLLPWQPNSALLFRPLTDGNGDFVNYSVSTITLSAVPEPMASMWCLLGAGMGCRVARRCLHRRRVLPAQP